MFLIIGVLAPALAWPGRGKEDSFIDRRDAIAILTLGHEGITRTYRTLGGIDGIRKHNAQLGSLASIESVTKTGRSRGDSIEIRVAVRNTSDNPVGNVLFIDNRPKSFLVKAAPRPMMAESPKGWIVRPGKTSAFATWIPATAFTEAQNLLPWQIGHQVNGQMELMSYWSVGRPESILLSWMRKQ